MWFRCHRWVANFQNEAIQDVAGGFRDTVSSLGQDLMSDRCVLCLALPEACQLLLCRLEACQLLLCRLEACPAPTPPT
eukprot:SAG22_NODE_1094_length_5587_cov_6.950580_5_plen_78_part_00